MSERLKHTWPAVYDKDCTVLILGTFPSVKSRENKFYYGNPQNRFWRVIAAICKEQLPNTVEEKKELLLKHHIAIWDVIESCEITGSSDASIRDVKVHDIAGLIKKTKIKSVYANGNKAAELYMKYAGETANITAVTLPSTSPANAAWGLERLVAAWKDHIAI